MNITEGDIYWVTFPATEAREQAGHRPALIVQSERFNQLLPKVGEPYFPRDRVPMQPLRASCDRRKEIGPARISVSDRAISDKVASYQLAGGFQIGMDICPNWGKEAFKLAGNTRGQK